MTDVRAVIRTVVRAFQQDAEPLQRNKTRTPAFSGAETAENWPASIAATGLALAAYPVGGACG